MIDEDELRDLLREAAGAVPPPGRAPEALAARLTQPTAPRRPSRKATVTGFKVLGAAAAIILVIAGLAALGTSTNSNDSAQVRQTSADGGGTAARAPESTAPRAGFNEAEKAAAAPPTTVAAAAPPKASSPTDGAKIVKTGSMEIEVRKGSFERVVDQISAQVVGLGGFISKSETNESDDNPSGSLTVRVPVDSFEALQAKLRTLGKVGSVTVKGTDVTAQYTDLEARKQALIATRDRLNSVLAQASTVGDILAVQDRITQVQTEIEQLQGQQAVLDDQASFATMALALAEPGPPVETVAHEQDDGRGLGDAWADARRRFGDGIEGIVAWSGPIAIVLILAAILFVIGRLGWVVVRRFTM